MPRTRVMRTVLVSAALAAAVCVALVVGGEIGRAVMSGM